MNNYYSNSSNDITSDVGTNIYKMIDRSLESNSVESFFAIDGFCYKILFKSIQNGYMAHFKDYLSIPISYYTQSYKYRELNNVLYKKITEACFDMSARRIKEIIWVLNTPRIKQELVQKKKYETFCYLAFSNFSQLFYEIIGRKDFVTFKSASEQIHGIYLGVGNSFEEVINARKKETYGETSVLKGDMQALIFFRSMILGLKYWLYFLFDIGFLDGKGLDLFLGAFEEINEVPLFEEFELLFNKLNSASMTTYFNWQSWDYVTHPEGDAYFMNNPIDWIVKGYAVDILKSQIVKFDNIDINKFDNIDRGKNVGVLIFLLKKHINDIKRNDKWKDYLGNRVNDSVYQEIDKELDLIESQLESKGNK